MRVHSRRKSKFTQHLKLLLIVFLLVGAGLLLPALVTSVSRVVLYPVYATQNWFRESSATLPTYLRDKKELIDEIQSLKNKVALAGATDVTQQRLFDENQYLRELLGAEEEDRIAAAVVARPNELPYDFLQVDQGSEDGVVVGAPVYVGADNVIGIVAHTAPHFSFIELFTTPGFEATTFVSGSNVVATLEGYGGGVARVRVPQGIPLTVGSVVHMPSIQPGAFGRIAYVESRPSQPEQYGYITLDKPINSIHYVAVGTQPLTPATKEEIHAEIESIINESLRFDASQIPFATTTSSTTESNEEAL